jgi:hypothetical protein
VSENTNQQLSVVISKGLELSFIISIASIHHVISKHFVCVPQSTLQQPSNVLCHGEGIYNALPEIAIVCRVFTQRQDKN